MECFFPLVAETFSESTRGLAATNNFTPPRHRSTSSMKVAVQLQFRTVRLPAWILYTVRSKHSTPVRSYAVSKPYCTVLYTELTSTTCAPCVLMPCTLLADPHRRSAGPSGIALVWGSLDTAAGSNEHHIRVRRRRGMG